jgi:hypothetical protein
LQVCPFFVHAGQSAGGGLPQFVKDGFDALLESGILAHGSRACAAGIAGNLSIHRGCLVLVEDEEGSTCLPDNDGDSDRARPLRPLQPTPRQYCARAVAGELRQL